MATYGGAPYGGVGYAGAFSAITGTLGLLHNTILDPAQLPIANVQVEIKLMPTSGFRNYVPNTEVARQVTVITNAVGYWECPVEANANILPAGSWYQVTELIPDVDGGKRVWYVRVTANAIMSVSSAQVTSLP